MNQNEIAYFLKSILLFSELDDEQIYRVAKRFETVIVDADELLFSEGDPATGFFIITEGNIHLSRDSGRGNTKSIGILEVGDFFGEEGLLTRRPRSATAVAGDKTTLLKINTERFDWLVSEFPYIRQELATLLRSYRLGRSKRFNWLAVDEVLHLVARKHLYLMILPAITSLTLFGVSLWLFIMDSTPLKVLAGLITIFAVLWLIWKWIDWGNDYYILTDLRVIWSERVILLYDSRQEAPLDEVLSVNISSNQLQRIVGSGDVIVRTYTGSIVMRNLDQPKRFASMVEEYWHRAQTRFEKTQTEAMREAIREQLVTADKKETIPALPSLSKPEPKEEGKQDKPGLMANIFTNFLKTRYEVDGVITYRKHWFLLVRKIWPLLVLLILGFSYLGIRLAGFVETPSVGMLLLGILLVVFSLSPWWLYQYVDWRNDIYQVSEKHIFDINRKPLGRELKKSAPLENILNMSLEQTFIERIFNFGNVVINVGEVKFHFSGVQNPSEVQLELFQRYNARRRQLEMNEAARERQRIADWLGMYHDEAENFRQNQNQGNQQPNSG